MHILLFFLQQWNLTKFKKNWALLSYETKTGTCSRRARRQVTDCTKAFSGWPPTWSPDDILCSKLVQQNLREARPQSPNALTHSHGPLAHPIQLLYSRYVIFTHRRLDELLRVVCIKLLFLPLHLCYSFQNQSFARSVRVHCSVMIRNALSQFPSLPLIFSIWCSVMCETVWTEWCWIYQAAVRALLAYLWLDLIASLPFVACVSSLWFCVAAAVLQLLYVAVSLLRWVLCYHWAHYCSLFNCEFNRQECGRNNINIQVCSCYSSTLNFVLTPCSWIPTSEMCI